MCAGDDHRNVTGTAVARVNLGQPMNADLQAAFDYGVPVSKVLVLVLGTDMDPWGAIERAQRLTCCREVPASVTVRWLYGRESAPERFVARGLKKTLDSYFLRAAGPMLARLPVRERGDRLETCVPEIYTLLGAKVIAGFRHVLDKYEFEYLFRTNVSSYVVLPRLRKFVETLPTTYYGGFIGEMDKTKYASGAGILISRDLVEAAARDPDWEYDIIDDVALGRSVLRKGVEPQPIPRIDIPSVADLDRLSLEDEFVFRCKALNGRTRDDARVLRGLHALIQDTEVGC